MSRKEGRDSPALEIAQMHQCKDKRTKTICDKKRRKRIRQHWVLHRCIYARTKEQKLYATRKGGRGFPSIGYCIDASMQGQKNKNYMRQEKGEEDSPALGIA